MSVIDIAVALGGAVCFWLLGKSWRGEREWFHGCQGEGRYSYDDPPDVCPDCGKRIVKDER